MAVRPGPDPIADVQAERAILGSLFIDPSRIGRIADTLAPADFWTERHAWVYEAMLALYRDGEVIDNVTVTDRLKQAGKLEDVGGQAYLAGLVASSVWTHAAVDYARVVSRLAVLRRLVAAAGRIAQAAHQPDAIPEEVFDQARRLIDGVAPLQLDSSVLAWRDSLGDWLAGQVEREEEAKSANARVRFPWMALQQRVRWLRPGMLAVIAADSGVGKTLFLECCAEAWAKVGHHIAFFHFELSHQVMLDRRMARQSGVSISKIEDGHIDEQIQEATGRMSEWAGGINYVHCPGWTMGQVAATARKLAARGMADVVIVDYLQKARLLGDSGMNSAQERGQQVEVLKVVAEQLGMPILLAAQFNRSSWGPSRKSRHMIRGTGEADEKANVVILLDREVLDGPQRDSSGSVVAQAGEMSRVVKITVDKNTLGSTGDDELVLNPVRFLMLDKSRVRGERDD